MLVSFLRSIFFALPTIEIPSDDQSDGSYEETDHPRETGTVRRLTKKNEDLAKQLQEFRTKYTSAKSRFRKRSADYENSIRALQEEVSLLRDTLQTERERVAGQTGDKNSELEALRAFLDIHDDADASSIGDQLSNINDLIEQLASDVSLRWPTPKHNSVAPVDEVAYNQMENVIGGALASALVKCDVANDALTSFLQITVQAIAVYWVFELFQNQAYYAGGSADQVSQKVREEEIQPVYGRWRAMTRKYIRLTRQADEEKTLLLRFASSLAGDIFQSAILLGFPLVPADLERLQEDLQTSVREIARKTLKLAITVTEEVISKDYHFYCPRSFPFDPQYMEVPKTFSPATEGDVVAVCVGLGMTAEGKKGREHVQVESRIFRKAAVITELTIKELLKPQTKLTQKLRR